MAFAPAANTALRACRFRVEKRITLHGNVGRAMRQRVLHSSQDFFFLNIAVLWLYGILLQTTKVLVLEAEMEMNPVSPRLDLEKDTSEGAIKLWHDQCAEPETF